MNNEIFSIFHENQFFTPFLNIFLLMSAKICVRDISRTDLPFWLIFWHMIDTMHII